MTNVCERAPAASDPRISGGRGCRCENKGTREGEVMDELFFATFETLHERAETRSRREEINENGGANRRFFGLHPGRFRRRRGVSPRTRGAVGARALDRRTLLNATVPCRSTSHTVPCLVDASPRVMTTSCPSKDCGSEERTVRNDWKIRSRAFHLRRVGGGSRDWRRRRRAWRREMIAKPIARTTHLEIRLVQPRQRMLVRRTLREARGSRQGAGQPMGVRVGKPSNEKKQRVRLRRKRARVRVSRDETKYRLPRAHLAHLCHRHRISRGLSLRDPSVLSLHRPFATDAFASCKLKRRRRRSGWPAACDASATDRSAHSAEDPI